MSHQRLEAGSLVNVQGSSKENGIGHVVEISRDSLGQIVDCTMRLTGEAAAAAAAAAATTTAVRPKALKERSQNVKPPAKKLKSAPPQPSSPPPLPQPVVEENSGLNLTVLSGSGEDDESEQEEVPSLPCTEHEIDSFRGKLNALLTGIRVEQSAALALHPQSPRQANALLQQLHDDGLFFINEGFVYRV
ncbi:hypothetical protein BASA81_004230 [Batrachochytrium salamandrivorans]|nr:hypothetical protein BASA81_004230 [Batrachochytrium salamandrivorans]